MESYGSSLTTNASTLNFSISPYYSSSNSILPPSSSLLTSNSYSSPPPSYINGTSHDITSTPKKEDALQQFENSRIKILQEERLHIQKKTFTKWINSFLNKARLEVFDLFTDLSDGKMLLKLLEIISGEKLGKPNAGRMRVHKVENVNKALAFLHTKVRLESIGAEDIVDGNPRLILGLIWTIILRFHIQEIEICLDEENESSEKKSAKDALLLWCQRKTSSYQGVNICDFTASWRSGMGFNALIHAHRPDLVDYRSLENSNYLENLNNAFRIAHEDLGVARILDAEDVDTNKPDEKSIITYVASYYHTFARMRDEMKGSRRIANIMTRMKDVDDSKMRFEDLVTELLEWIRNKVIELDNRDFPNSLDGVQRLLIEFKRYRTEEKPPKYIECSEIEALFFSINASLKTLNQSAFIPKDGHMLKDIEREWQNLVKAEHKREVALREELMRQEGLEHLAFKFEKKSVLRKGYLEEMVQVLSDSRYGSNLFQVDATVKKHEAISADILAREDRFEDLTKMCNELYAENYHDKETIKKKVDLILKKWNDLLVLLQKHKESLQKAHLLMTILREADTLQDTISEIKANLRSDDIGGFLLAVEDLIHKHTLMESQVNSIGETIKKLNKQGKTLIASASGHKDIPLLEKKLKELTKEFENLTDLSCSRKVKLEEARKFYQFQADMKEEEAWVVERQRICQADVSAKGLRSVLALQQKHKALEDEMRARKPKSESIIRSGEDINSKDHPNVFRVQEEVNLLRSLWTQLDDCAAMKKKQLADAVEAFSLVADANEVESWIKEKLPLVQSTDFGEDELGARALLQLNTRLEGEIKVYDADIKALNNLGEKLIQSGIRSLNVVSQNGISEEKSSLVNGQRELVSEEYWEEIVTEKVEEQIVFEEKMMNVVKAKYPFEGQGMSMAKGEEMILLSKTNDDWWNVRKTTGEEGFVPANYVREVAPRLIKVKVKKLKKTPLKHKVKRKRLVPVTMDNKPKPPPRRRGADEFETVERRLKSVNGAYEELKRLASKRSKLLEESIKILAFERECSSFDSWMKEKEKMLIAEDTSEGVEIAKKKFKQFLTDMFTANKRKEEIDKMVADMSLLSDHSQMNKVKLRQSQIHDQWERLNRLKQEKERTLEGASSVELFHRTCDEATDWMTEKMEKLDAEEFGSDLKTIKALQRRHDQLERELAPIEEQVNIVKTFASSVKMSYVDEKKVVENREMEILGLWQKLKGKATDRRNRLEEAVGNQVFVNAAHNLFDWIREVKEALNSSEVARDVSTAEKLLERQNELGDDIRAHQEEFREVKNLGKSLIKRNPNLVDIKEKLNLLSEEESAINRGWQEKGDWLRQCLDLQLFNREADNIDATTRAHEAFLDFTDLGDSLDEVETLQKRHDDFENTLIAQDERLRIFSDMASKLIAANHYDTKYIDERRLSVIQKRNNVKEKSQKRRSLLDKAQAFEQFRADVDEFSKWIALKIKKLDDETYKDLSNLERKIQKHKAFSQELCSNETQLRRLNKTGEDLISIHHYRSNDIKEILAALNSQWQDLANSVKQRDLKLNQAIDQLSFNGLVENASNSLDVLENSFSQTVVGTDLRSCRDLLNKQKNLESEVKVIETKISEVKEVSQHMTQYGHFDSKRISEKCTCLHERLQKLTDPCKDRRFALEESLKFHQFKFLIEAEIQWISDHKPFTLSAVVSHNLYEAQNLIKKHEKFVTEVHGHQFQIDKALNQGTKLIEEKHPEKEQIEHLCNLLKDNWSELNSLMQERKLRLESSLKVQNYYFEANEIETWLNEKWTILQSKDYGKDENAARKILTKHKGLELEIDTYEGLVKELGIKAECMIKANHPESKLIKEKQQMIQHDLVGVQRSSNELRQKLMESMYRHEYFREAEELHKWINEQLQIASSDDYGTDYEHLLVLQSKFNEFKHRIDVGSERFKQCEDLAQKLISNENFAAVEIEENLGSIRILWNKLLELLNIRERKLDEAGYLHRFSRDVAESLSRIQEKTSSLPEDFGRSVHSVESLIRKHEGFENDLIALEAQLQVLGDDAKQLKAKLTENEAEYIDEQKAFVTAKWKFLQDKALKRKNLLNMAKDYQKFLAMSRDLISWSNYLRSCMKTQEKVRDAASAQALKGEHEHLKAEIEAREDTFQDIVNRGKSMVENSNLYSSEIQDRTNKVLEERSQLHSAWQNKKVYLDQLIDLQFFLRDVKQLHALCLSQEASLSSSELGDSIEAVDALVRKHLAFNKVIEAQEEKFEMLNMHGMKLMEQNHFYSSHIKNHMAEVAERRMIVKKAAKKRQLQLEDAQLHAQFIRDVIDANAWVSEKWNLIENEKQKGIVTSFEDKIKKLQKHQAFMAEVRAHESRISEIFQRGNVLINKHRSSDVKEQLLLLKRNWDRLLADSETHFRGLEEAQDILEFNTLVEKLEAWIKDKELLVQAGDLGKDLEHCLGLKRKLEDVDSDMRVDDNRFHSLNQLTDKIISHGRADSDFVEKRRDELNYKWRELKGLIDKYHEKLCGALDVHSFIRDVDDAKERISEKSAMLSSEESCRNLVQVELLQRKQDSLLCDLSAIQKQVDSHTKMADNLSSKYPHNENEIRKKFSEEIEEWSKMKSCWDRRKELLSSWHKLHKFLEDTKELKKWQDSIISRMENVQRPLTVIEAELKIREHQEVKVEIENREETFSSLSSFVSQLLEESPDLPLLEEFKLNVDKLHDMKSQLWNSWNNNFRKISHTHKLLVYTEMTEAVESWLSSKEAHLCNDDLGESISSVESLIRKHESFQKTFQAQANKLDEVKKMAKSLLDENHEESDFIKSKLDSIIARWSALQEASEARKEKLRQSKSLHQFFRNLSEVEGWIIEKTKVATDMCYTDPTNLLSKMQKHGAFEAELTANAGRIVALSNEGKDMIEEEHYSKLEIRSSIDHLQENWQKLLECSSLKKRRLSEAYQALLFNRNLDDLDAWMNDVEGNLQSEDHGHDLTSVRSLQVKHQRVEEDISSHQSDIEQAKEVANSFIKEEHFMSDTIAARNLSIEKRYISLQEAVQIRKDNLNDSYSLHQILRDIEDESVWLSEKGIQVSCADLGSSLVHVQNLQKKHQVVETEIQSHEPLINSLNGRAQQLIRSSHFAAQLIEDKMNELLSKLNTLKDSASVRRLRLLDAVESQMFYCECSEADAWMEEKRPLVTSAEFGKDEDSVVALLKKLQNFERDLDNFGSTIEKLKTSSEKLISRKHFDSENIKEKLNTVVEKHETLHLLKEKRFERLEESSKLYKFLGVCNEVIEWLLEQTAVAASEDYGQDVEHVEILIQKFDSFMSLMSSNEEKIDVVREEAKTLLQNKHPEPDRISEKLNEAIQLWEDLKELANARQEALAGAKQVHVFDRDAEETKCWIAEKVAAISTDDYGQDLETVQILTRKHQSFERDLAAVKEQVESVVNEAKRLAELFPDASDHISVKHEETVEAWNFLLEKSAQRKDKLQQADKMQAYFDEYRELLAWLNEMIAKVTAPELPKDISGSEAILVRHKEYKVEIDSRSDAMQKFFTTGRTLVEQKHFMSDEIAEKISNLEIKKNVLHQHWEGRLDLYEKNHDLRVFLSNVQIIESWINSRELVVSDEYLGETISEVEDLLRHHDDFMKTVEAQEDKLEGIKRITLIEEMYKAQKLLEEQAKRAEVQRKQQERAEAMKRKEVLRITDARRREGGSSIRKISELIYGKSDSDRSHSNSYKYEDDRDHSDDELPGLDESLAASNQKKDLNRTESMNGKKVKRVPSFTTRRRTHSFRKHNKIQDLADLPPVELQGYLERKQELQSGGKKATIRSWKLFYTVLCGQLVCFFKDDGDFYDQKAASPPLSIHQAKIERADDYTKRKNVFRIITRDAAEYLFLASSEEHMEEWVMKLTFHAKLPPSMQLMSYDNQKSVSESSTSLPRPDADLTSSSIAIPDQQFINASQPQGASGCLDLARPSSQGLDNPLYANLVHIADKPVPLSSDSCIQVSSIPIRGERSPIYENRPATLPLYDNTSSENIYQNFPPPANGRHRSQSTSSRSDSSFRSTEEINEKESGQRKIYGEFTAGTSSLPSGSLSSYYGQQHSYQFQPDPSPTYPRPSSASSSTLEHSDVYFEGDGSTMSKESKRRGSVFKFLSRRKGAQV